MADEKPTLDYATHEPRQRSRTVRKIWDVTGQIFLGVAAAALLLASLYLLGWLIGTLR